LISRRSTSFFHSHAIEMSSARDPNLPRSSGPQIFSHAAAPIRRRIHADAVIDSNADTSWRRRCSASTESPIRNRDTNGSGRKRSRSSGETNGHERPSTKNPTDDSRHSSSSGIPSSSYRRVMCTSEVNRWW
jgi:hypothetical protein